MPFLLLVLLLTGVGLIMLLSASFPSAYYESGDPLYYFKRQAAFATLGLAAMVVIGRINYARFRGVAKIALGISIALLVSGERVTAADCDTDGCASSLIAAATAASLAVGKTLDEAVDIDEAAVVAAVGRFPDDDRHCAYLAAAAVREAVHHWMIHDGTGSAD